VTVSIWQADDTQPIREVDFLVVGAGIVGCSAAYFARPNQQKVTFHWNFDVQQAQTKLVP
jgi:succinate dehydrogenase/fumarate reductase flavoprotein subunit